MPDLELHGKERRPSEAEVHLVPDGSRIPVREQLPTRPSAMGGCLTLPISIPYHFLAVMYVSDVGGPSPARWNSGRESSGPTCQHPGARKGRLYPGTALKFIEKP